MMSLAWPLFRVTEQAALAAWPQTGCGDKNKIDGLAVTAMRQALPARHQLCQRTFATAVVTKDGDHPRFDIVKVITERRMR